MLLDSLVVGLRSVELGHQFGRPRVELLLYREKWFHLFTLRRALGWAIVKSITAKHTAQKRGRSKS